MPINTFVFKNRTSLQSVRTFFLCSFKHLCGQGSLFVFSYYPQKPSTVAST